MTSVTTALSTGLGTVATSAGDMIAAIIPVAVPILGAILLITIGIRTFKKFK